MTDTPPEQVMLHRAIANALWPHLRRNRWKTHTCTRDLSKYNPRGYVAGPRSATVAQSPSASAVVELHHERYIEALLFAEEWPGKTSHALKLDFQNTHALLHEQSDRALYEYDMALRRATCRQPFHRQINRHGVMRLRRNAADEHITPLVAQILERIATLAIVRPVSEAAIDAFLIEDHEIDLAQIERAAGLPLAIPLGDK